VWIRLHELLHFSVISSTEIELIETIFLIISLRCTAAGRVIGILKSAGCYVLSMHNAYIRVHFIRTCKYLSNKN